VRTQIQALSNTGAVIFAPCGWGFAIELDYLKAKFLAMLLHPVAAKNETQ